MSIAPPIDHYIEYNKFTTDLIQNAAESSDVYNKRFKELSNTVKDKLDIVEDEFLFLI